MAAEGDALRRKAAQVLDAAEAALIRANDLEAQIASGETTRREVDTRTRRAVARTGQVGSPARNQAIKEEARSLKQVTVEEDKAASASQRRTAALKAEAAAEREVSRAAQRQAQTLSPVTEIRRRGPLGGSLTQLAQAQAQANFRNIQAIGRAPGGVLDPDALRAQSRSLDDLTSRLRLLNQLGPLAGSRAAGAVLGDMSQADLQAFTRAIDRAEQYRRNIQNQPIGPAQAIPPTTLGPTQPFLLGPAGGGIAPPGGRPPAPPGPPGGGYGFSDEFNEELAKGRREQQLFRGEMSRLITTQGQASQMMRRHGALTTEFVQAAQRGEVTIRELGFQTSATIGKFAGWLGAGAAIYGVVGAVSALGRGAIDTYSGVNQLSRVITHDLDAEKARNDFRALSQEFNLPIAEVTESVYQMGKVFHDQSEATEAARAVLFSVKVGELDVATATRYLTAIANGYNLEIQRMTVFTDQVNQAQNKFGITVSDVEAGVAKAAGTFRAAGGGLNELLALVTTAQKATGVTGEVAGTALARAPNFLRQEANQRALQEFGINAQAPIDQIIEQAMKTARRLSGEQVQQLASAIFGPQYGARIGTPLLNQLSLYQDVLDKTSPAKAQGSAQRELRRQLGSVEEQLKRVGVTLQSLGAGLAEAHFFDFLGAGLRLLNETLSTATDLVDVFNEMPEGLQQALVYMTQIALALRLLRRFQLGEAIGGGPSATPTGARAGLATFFGEGQRGTARRYRAGLFEEQKFLEEERARTTTQAARLATRWQASMEQYVATEKRVTREMRALPETETAKRAVLESELATARSNVTARRQQIDQLALESRLNSERLGLVNEQIANTRKTFLRPGLNVPATLEEMRRSGLDPSRPGVFFPSTFERPSTEVLSTAGDPHGRQAAAVAAAEAERRAAARQSDVARTLQTQGEESLRQFSETEKAARAAQAGALASEAQVERSGTALQRATSTFNRILGAAGNLLFAAFLADLAGQMIKDFIEGQAEAVERAQAEAIVRTQQQADAARRSLRDQGAANTEPQAKSLLDSIGDTISDPLGFQRQAEEIQRQAYANLKLQAEQRRAARQEGRAVPFRYAADIEKDIERVVEARRGDRETDKKLKQYRDELALSIEQLGQGEGSVKDQQRRVRILEDRIRQARADNAGTRELAERVAGLTQDAVTERLQAELTLAGEGPRSHTHIERARTYYEKLAQDLYGSNDPEAIQALAEAREDFLSGVADLINTELESALSMARTPSDIQAAYAEAQQRARQELVTESQRDLRAARENVSALETQLKGNRYAYRHIPIGDLVQQSLIGPLLGEDTPNIAKQLSDEAKELEQKIKAGRGDVQALRNELREAQERYKQVREEMERQEFETLAAVREARFQARQAQTADPLIQAAREVRFTTRELGRVIQEYGRGTEEFFAALQARRDAIQSQVQAAFGLFQARQRLSIAGITDPDARARAELGNLRDELAYMQAHRDSFSQEDIINQMAEIREAEADLQETVADNALELRQAAIAVRQARAEARGNEVRAAILELRSAQAALDAADTPLERLQAQADVIAARARVRDERYNTRVEDIEYEADIGRLTLQQQIQAYQRLLRTMELTRDARRDLRRRIYQLQQETEGETGEFDLRLDSIRLPTVYEVRRALQNGGRNGGNNVSLTQNNKWEITGSNAKEIGDEIERRMGDSEKRAASLARSAGLNYGS